MLRLNFTLICGVLSGIVASSPVLFAQSTEQQILTPSDDTEYFGFSVSLSGDAALVGAYGEWGENGELSGAAYVFRQIGGVWTEEQRLTASDGDFGDLFGWSVSVSGDVALIGARADDPGGSLSGSVYVFRRSGGNWIEEQKLIASDGEGSDNFGGSVSISGEIALMGASGDDDLADLSGAAYVFRRIDGIWVEEQKLTASDGSDDDQFGDHVSISDEIALIGAPFDGHIGEPNGDNSGSVYVFQWNGTSWVEEQKLTASDASAHDRFGSSVSVFEDVALIGAEGRDEAGLNRGSAYVFRLINGIWVEEQKLLPDDAEDQDNFGTSVSVSGDIALAGSPGDDDSGAGSGSAYVFDRVDGEWEQSEKLVASDGEEGDHLGGSVSLSLDVALVGAWQTNGLMGSAYVFDATVVGIEEFNQHVPSRVALSTTYPNPVHDKATIKFTVPQSRYVALRAYDLLGREVDVLYEREVAAGEQEVAFDVGHLAPGVYLLRLETESGVATQRLTVIR